MHYEKPCGTGLRVLCRFLDIYTKRHAGTDLCAGGDHQPISAAAYFEIKIRSGAFDSNRSAGLIDPERPRQQLDLVDADAALAAFDRIDIGVTQASIMRPGFLRQAARLALAPKVGTEYLARG